MQDNEHNSFFMWQAHPWSRKEPLKHAKPFSCRISPAAVQLFLDSSEHPCEALLEIWTDEESMAPTSMTATPAVQVRVQSLGNLAPVETGRHQIRPHDVIIGYPGMMNLGLRCNARSQKLYRFKRILRS